MDVANKSGGAAAFPDSAAARLHPGYSLEVVEYVAEQRDQGPAGGG